MPNSKPLEVVYLRLPVHLRKAVREWKERVNKKASNPMNDSDALRFLIAAGLEAQP